MGITIEEIEKRIKTPDCKMCGVRSICEKFQAYKRLRIYISGIDFKLMGSDCGFYEYQFQKMDRTRKS